MVSLVCYCFSFEIYQFSLTNLIFMKCCCRMTPKMKIRLFCGIILLLATLSQDKLPYYPYCAEVLLLLFQFKVSCLSFLKNLKCHFLTIFGWWLAPTLNIISVSATIFILYTSFSDS